MMMISIGSENKTKPLSMSRTGTCCANKTSQTLSGQRRAPLLETISTLSSALIYSDHSSNSSVSDENIYEDNHHQDFELQTNQHYNVDQLSHQDENDLQNIETSNDLVKLVNKNDQSVVLDEVEKHEQQAAHRSKVRFNNDVQVSSLNVHYADKSPSLMTIQLSQLDDGQWSSKYELTSSTQSIDSNEPSLIYRSNEATISPLTASSSSSSNSLNSTHSADGINVHLPPLVSYTNLPALKHSQSPQPKTLCSDSTSLGVQHFKSILKDPLCAKLRNSLRLQTKQNNSESQTDTGSQQTQDFQSKSSWSSVMIEPTRMITTINTIDTDRLESEIDQLLYGQCPIEDSADNNDYLEHTISSTHEVLFSKNESLSVNRPIDNIKNNRINKLLAVSSSVNGMTSSTSNQIRCQLPYQTYIQMIEEKYRSTNNNRNSRKIQPLDLTTNYLNAIKSTTNSFKHKFLIDKTKLPWQFTGKSKNQTKSLTNNKNITSNKLNLMSPMIPQPTTIDQWMATLAQESSRPLDRPDEYSIQEETNIGEQLNCKIKSRGSLNVRQEELYTMLSDPVKGPSINKLMDQLMSKSWPIIQNENDESNQKKSGSFIKLYSHPNANTKYPVMENVGTRLSSSSSSTSSSSLCSTTTARSRSLVENHIYEEILYECLQQDNRTEINNL